MSLSSPVTKGLIFILIVLFYFLLGYLNYTRALKIAFVGFFSIWFFANLQAYFRTKIFRWFLSIVVLVLFMNLGFHAILRDLFGVAQEDIIVIQSVMNSDVYEAKEFIFQYRWFLIKHLFLLGIFYVLYMRFVITRENHSAVTPKALLISLFFYILIHLNPSMRRSDPFVYFVYYYTKYQQSMEGTKQLLQRVKENLKSKKISCVYQERDEENILVWVIGESDTRWNWSLYGYKRDTNRYLEPFKNELRIVKNVKAAAPATVAAFELMMTEATKKKSHLWNRNPNIVMLANMAGYETYWISNHTSDKWGVINLFAQSAKKTVFTNRGRARGEGSFDEAVLKPFEEAMKSKAKKKLIIVHLMGSHPAYDYRYPKKFGVYTFVFDDPVIRNLVKKGRYKAALVFRNLYDNTIVYSDYVRSKILSIIKRSKQKQNVTFLYHPDHGQDVCHNGNFSGHNYESMQQWDVPMVVWGKGKSVFDAKSLVELDTIDRTILKLLKVSYHKERSGK